MARGLAESTARWRHVLQNSQRKYPLGSQPASGRTKVAPTGRKPPSSTPSRKDLRGWPRSGCARSRNSRGIARLTLPREKQAAAAAESGTAGPHHSRAQGSLGALFMTTSLRTPRWRGECDQHHKVRTGQPNAPPPPAWPESFFCAPTCTAALPRSHIRLELCQSSI